MSLNINAQTTPTVSCPNSTVVKGISSTVCTYTLEDLITEENITITTASGNYTDLITIPEENTILQGNIAGDTSYTLQIHAIDPSISDTLQTACSFILNIIDRTSPNLTCPAISVPLIALPNCMVSVPDYTGMTVASDNCDPQLELTQSPVSGSFIGLGEQSITVSTTDSAGNNGDCFVTLTVRENNAPQLSGPFFLQRYWDASCQYITEDFSSSYTTTDFCTPDNLITFEQTPISGSLFDNEGDSPSNSTEQIAITVTDTFSNTANRTLSLSITDTIVPTVTCPPSDTLRAGTTCTALIPDYRSQVNIIENCRIQDTSQSPFQGTPISVGNNQVSISSFDISGNSGSCTFNVIVTDSTAPNLSCPTDTSVFAGTTCGYTLPDFRTLATVSDNCTATSAILITQSPNNNSILQGTQNHAVTITAQDNAGNNSSCTFQVTLVDTISPTFLNCLADRSANVTTNCNYTLPDYTTQTVGTDNCDNTLSITQQPAAGSTVGIGSQEITLVLSDDSGNTDTCRFDVNVTDITAPNIVCPANQNKVANTSCVYSTEDFRGSLSISDNCDARNQIIVNQLLQAPGTVALPGTHAILIEATDQSGNNSSCSFSITVSDQNPPTIVCPGNQNRYVNSTCTYTLEDFSNLATGTDNCTASSLLSYTQSPALGTVLNSGNQLVTLSVTDAEGLQANCNFNLTVTDTTRPNITYCPPSQNIFANSNCQGIVPDFQDTITFTDNCSASTDVTFTQSPTVAIQL